MSDEKRNFFCFCWGDKNTPSIVVGSNEFIDRVEVISVRSAARWVNHYVSWKYDIRTKFTMSSEIHPRPPRSGMNFEKKQQNKK